MRHVPRFALGTIQPGSSRDPGVWGLVAALSETGDSPLLFRASFDLSCPDGSRPIIGRASRHLDSWAMSRSDAISALARAATDHDTAIIEGAFDSATRLPLPPGEGADRRSAGEGLRTPSRDGFRSSLDRLCQWLDLPRIAIVDVRHLANCGLTLRHAKIDALLLDRVRDDYDAAYWQTTLESLWKTPVLGWLDEAAPLRTACASLAPTIHPPRELCAALGHRLLPTLRLDRLRQLARKPAALSFEPEAWLLGAQQRHFRIAVAMDEIYCGYYPETLDLLEAAGAELCDFSPLRSESIPDNCEVVYFGCGHPERRPDELAANHCLKQSLRSYAAAGGRIYAEGGGLAYLCREMTLHCGRSISMTGLLPATARLQSPATSFEPAEITFGLSSWLAPARVSLRGYRHTGWQIEPHGALLTYADNPEHRLDMLGRDNIIASRVLINLAANRHLLRRFFEPYLPLASALRRDRE